MSRDVYRCVLTFQYANGPLVVEGKPKSRDGAMAEFDRHIAAGGFGQGCSARVISEKTWLESQEVKP